MKLCTLFQYSKFYFENLSVYLINVFNDFNFNEYLTLNTAD